jgi:hypothetical protein
VGENLEADSEWKQIPRAFHEGLVEGEITARARNAKQMDLLADAAEIKGNELSNSTSRESNDE